MHPDDMPTLAELGEPVPPCGPCAHGRHDECRGCGCECNRPDEPSARELAELVEDDPARIAACDVPVDTSDFLPVESGGDEDVPF